MATLEINVSGAGPGGGSGSQLLENIDRTLKRIEQTMQRQNRSAQIVNRSLTIQQTIINRTAISVRNVTNVMVQAERATNSNAKAASRWATALKRVGAQAQKVTRAMAAFSKRRGNVFGGATSSVTSAFSSSFQGAFGGGGLAGLAGAAVRVPMGALSAMAKIGGDLGKAVLGGFGGILGSAGGALSGVLEGAGAIAGIPLAGAGGLMKMLGDLVGLSGQALGGILDAAGKAGGAIAESLFGGFTKVALAAGAVAAVSIKSAMDVENISEGFGALTKDFGSQEEVLQKLRAASKGTISDYQLMKNANLALQLQVVENVEEFETLITASRRLGKAFGRDATEALTDFTVGLGRQSRLILDNVGLFVKVEAANKAYALSIGKTTDELTDSEKKVAFLDEAWRQANVTLKKLGIEQDTSSLKWDRMKTVVKNTAAAFGSTLLPVFNDILDKIQPMARATQEWVKANKDLITDKVVGFFEKIPDWLERAKNAAVGLAVGLGNAFGVDVIGRARDLLGIDTEQSPQNVSLADPPMMQGLARGFEPLASEFMLERPQPKSEGGGFFDKLKSSAKDWAKDFLDGVVASEKWEAIGEKIGDGINKALGGFVDKVKTASAIINAAPLMAAAGPGNMAAAYLLNKIDTAGAQGPDFPAPTGADGQPTLFPTPSGPSAWGAFGGPGMGPGPGSGGGQVKAWYPPGFVQEDTSTPGTPGGAADPMSGVMGLMIQLMKFRGTVGSTMDERFTDVSRPTGSKMEHILERLADMLQSGGLSDVEGKFGGESSPRLSKIIGQLASEFEKLKREGLKEFGIELRAVEKVLNETSDGILDVQERQINSTEALWATQERLRIAGLDLAAAFEKTKASVVANANQRLGAVSGGITQRFGSQMDLPGVSMHARHAFMAAARQRRRSEARRINETFESRGVQGFEQPVGAFGVVSEQNVARAPEMGGGPQFGFDQPLRDASDAEGLLLDKIQASSTFVQEQAQIIKETRIEAAKIKEEEKKALEKLAEESKAAFEKHQKFAEEMTKILQLMAQRQADQAAKFAALQKKIADVERNARAVARKGL